VVSADSGDKFERSGGAIERERLGEMERRGRGRWGNMRLPLRSLEGVGASGGVARGAVPLTREERTVGGEDYDMWGRPVSERRGKK
jgi:hypothetical protein